MNELKTWIVTTRRWSLFRRVAAEKGHQKIEGIAVVRGGFIQARAGTVDICMSCSVFAVCN